MLTTDSSLISAVSENTSLKATPKLTLEYNMNEMCGSVVVSGNHGTANDTFKTLFPASSVVSPFRPSKPGVRYAILGTTNTLTTYKTKDIPSVRTYMVDKDLPYSYFITQGSGSVTVSYYKDKLNTVSQNIYTNKIIVTVENTYSAQQPNISIGSLYTGSVPSNGKIVIGWNGTAWVANPTVFSTTNVPSLSSLTVSLSSVSNFAGIIEISPRLVIDVSNRIIRCSITKDDSLNDPILPVGMLTANSASIVLSTISNADIIQFNRGDDIVLNKVMIAKNVKCTISTVIQDNWTIQQGVFYISEFDLQDYGSYSITALDAAKFLQEINGPELIIDDASFQSIIWRLLDSVGFVDYDFTKCGSNILKCSYWWSNGTKTVWQLLQDLCRETQTLAFFDEFGVLKFIDRNTFYDKTKPADWTFRYAANGLKKPDIVNASLKQSPSTTEVKVDFNIPTVSTASLSAQPLWTEQDPSTLFAGPFQGFTGTGAAGDYIKYPGKGVFSDVIPTRFNSFVLLGSEIIEYDAIQFATSDNIYGVDVESSGQYAELRAKYKNNLSPTGKLRIKKRGALGTTQVNHTYTNAPLSGWSCHKIVLDKTTNQTFPVSSLAINYRSSQNLSAIGLSASSLKDDLYIVYKDLQHSDENIYQVGTSIGFSLANTTNISVSQRAGLAISWNPTTKTGYIILIDTVRSASNSSKKAEVFLIKVINGVSVSTQSVVANIFENQFYPVDVLVERQANKTIIDVVVKGSKIKFTDESSVVPARATVGIIVGGQSTAYFDYIYSKKLSSASMDLVNTRSAGKLVAKGFFSNFEFQQQSTLDFECDEFGSVIREIYLAKPTYQEAYPIIAEASNDLAQVVGGRLGYFKGEFYVFNTSSSTIKLSESSGRTLALYGVPIANSGQNTYETSKSNSKLRQVTTFSTQWIQDTDSAKSLTDFLVEEWSNSQIDVDLEVFGNPVLQVGDIVNIVYPDLGLSESNKFVIRSISQEIDSGISTKIKVRSIYAG